MQLSRRENLRASPHTRELETERQVRATLHCAGVKRFPLRIRQKLNLVHIRRTYTYTHSSFYKRVKKTVYTCCTDFVELHFLKAKTGHSTFFFTSEIDDKKTTSTSPLGKKKTCPKSGFLSFFLFFSYEPFFFVIFSLMLHRFAARIYSLSTEFLTTQSVVPCAALALVVDYTRSGAHFLSVKGQLFGGEGGWV